MNRVPFAWIMCMCTPMFFTRIFCSFCAGQYLPTENVRDIIRFCHEEGLMLFTDEVRQMYIAFAQTLFYFNMMSLTCSIEFHRIDFCRIVHRPTQSTGIFNLNNVKLPTVNCTVPAIITYLCIHEHIILFTCCTFAGIPGEHLWRRSNVSVLLQGSSWYGPGVLRCSNHLL